MTARSQRNPHASAGPGRLASGASSGPGGSLGCAVQRRLAPVEGSAVLPNFRHMVDANRQDASLTVVCQPLSQRHASTALVARPLRTGERASGTARDTRTPRAAARTGQRRGDVAREGDHSLQQSRQTTDRTRVRSAAATNAPLSMTGHV